MGGSLGIPRVSSNLSKSLNSCSRVFMRGRVAGVGDLGQGGRWHFGEGGPSPLPKTPPPLVSSGGKEDIGGVLEIPASYNVIFTCIRYQSNCMG